MFPVDKKATQEFTMSRQLLNQLKKRRLELGLKQDDMMMRIGVSRQQYQRLESKGNPRLDTLELTAKGLNSEIMLIPKEKVSAVIAALEGTDPDLASGRKQSKQATGNKKKSLADDPWQDILEDDI
jgi:transcriptional regulator with XRE-family HTH domain